MAQRVGMNTHGNERLAILTVNASHKSTKLVRNLHGWEGRDIETGIDSKTTQTMTKHILRYYLPLKYQ